MAAHTPAVTTAVTTNSTSYASGAFTPAVGDLLLVYVVAGATTAAGALTGTGAGLTFSRITNALFNSNGDRIYAFVADKLVTAAASQTVTFDCTGDAADGSIIFVFRVSGLTRTGLLAVRQSGVVSNNAASTPAISFPAVALTGNPVSGCLGNVTNPATMTAPTGFTESAVAGALGDVGYATPTHGGHAVYRDSGHTSATVTWGSASASVWGGIIVELDTSPPPLPQHVRDRANRPRIASFHAATRMQALRDGWERKRGILVPKLWLPQGV